MKEEIWIVEGVHSGKLVSDLPITYLLWFVGSHNMRRKRWVHCNVALREIHRRLEESRKKVEAELIADLRPRTDSERQEIKSRANYYLKHKC